MTSCRLDDVSGRYPDTTGAEQLKRERLLEILSQVDLEHLLEREGALTDEISKCTRSLCVVLP